MIPDYWDFIHHFCPLQRFRFFDAFQKKEWCRQAAELPLNAP